MPYPKAELRCRLRGFFISRLNAANIAAYRGRASHGHIEPRTGHIELPKATYRPLLRLSANGSHPYLLAAFGEVALVLERDGRLYRSYAERL